MVERQADDHPAATLGFDTERACGRGEQADAQRVDERRRRRRHRTESIDEPTRTLVQLQLTDARGELLIAAQSQAFVGHVLRREERGDGKCHGDLRGRFHNGFSLQRRDRVGKQVVVQLEPDCGDLSMLLLAEQVARTANLEVAHGQLETCAEILQVADDVESLVSLLRQ